MLPCVAVCCRVLQCGAVCCSVVQCVAVWCALDHGTGGLKVLQCGAVCGTCVHEDSTPKVSAGWNVSMKELCHTNETVYFKAMNESTHPCGCFCLIGFAGSRWAKGAAGAHMQICIYICICTCIYICI